MGVSQRWGGKLTCFTIDACNFVNSPILPFSAGAGTMAAYDQTDQGQTDFSPNADYTALFATHRRLLRTACISSI
jgi:hypothetical protein